jgi:hypothetical protein
MAALAAYDLEMAMWYGQFVIRGGRADGVPDDVLFDRAAAGEGVAGDGQSVLVLSPHQANVAMPIRVEVLTARPAGDLADWQLGYEAALTVDPEGLLLLNSPTSAQLRCTVPPDRYRLEVAGRGFVAYGWPGSTNPGDHWRIRLWPSMDGVEPRRVKEWTEPPFVRT